MPPSFVRTESAITHFAFLSPPYFSHLRLFEVLGTELIRRGHHVTFLLNAGFEGMVRARGMGVLTVPWRQGDPTPDAIVHNAERPTGLRGVVNIIADNAALTDQLCSGGPEMLRELGVHALVGDQLEPATGLIAAALRLPFVSVASALPLNRSPGVPLPYLNWRFDPSPRGVSNCAAAERIGAWLSKKQNVIIRRWAATFDAGPWTDINDCLSKRAQISQVIVGYDFPRPHPLPFAAVGPIRPPLAEEPPLPFIPDPHRPLVFASLGTIQGGRIDLFRLIARACRAAGAQIVIAHGGKLSAAQAATIDADHIADFLPQRRVLKAANLCVCHAGLNTVLDCIEAETPILARPFAFDQKGNGARILHHGIGGRMVGSRGPLRLRAQILGMLGDLGTKQRLRTLSEELKNAGGTARAATIIEQASRI